MRNSFNAFISIISDIRNSLPTSISRVSENPDEIYKKALESDKSSEYGTARSLYEKAIKLYENANQNKDVARVFSDLGYLSYRENNYDDAREFLQKSLTFFEKDGHSHLDLARVNLRFAHCYHKINDFSRSSSHIKEAIEIAEKQSFTKNERSLVDIFSQAGKLCFAMNHQDKGINYLKKSLENSFNILTKEDEKIVNQYDFLNEKDIRSFESNFNLFLDALAKKSGENANIEIYKSKLDIPAIFKDLIHNQKLLQIPTETLNDDQKTIREAIKVKTKNFHKNFLEICELLENKDSQISALTSSKMTPATEIRLQIDDSDKEIVGSKFYDPGAGKGPHTGPLALQIRAKSLGART